MEINKKFSFGTCWYCGSDKIIKYLDVTKFEDKRSIVRCSECDCIFALPLEPMQYNTTDKNWFHTVYVEALSIQLGLSLLDTLERYCKPRYGSMLEVGCAMGHFIFLAQSRGWNVTGVELAKEAAVWGRKYLRLNIKHEPVEEINFDRLFDAIVLIEVIEHVKDPLSLIKTCVNLLKPGGKLLLTTPNIGSSAFRLYGEKWDPIIPPAHLHYFSGKTLKNLLNRVGLNIFLLAAQVGETKDEQLVAVAGKKDSKVKKVYSFLKNPSVFIYNSQYLKNYYYRITNLRPSKKILREPPTEKYLRPLICENKASKVDETIGEITSGRKVGMFFKCSNDNLSGISFITATYNRINTGKGVFKITSSDDSEILFSEEFELSTVPNVRHKHFFFSQIENSRNREYHFSLSCPNSSSGNAITLFMTKEADLSAGKFFDNQQEMQGSLVYKLFYNLNKEHEDILRKTEKRSRFINFIKSMIL